MSCKTTLRKEGRVTAPYLQSNAVTFQAVAHENGLVAEKVEQYGLNVSQCRFNVLQVCCLQATEPEGETKARNDHLTK